MGKHIVVIGGSVRPNNYTMKAVRVLEEELKAQELSHEIIDPSSLVLPLPGSDYTGSSHEVLQASVKKATGVLLASPEYHGGISSVMKLIIDNLGFPSVLAAKPIALVGVAAGVIGAIKSLEMLRSICSHVGGIVLPGPVSVPRVTEVFDADGTCDPSVEKRIRGAVTNLNHYIDQNICPRIALENMVREEKEGI